jgi:hypothetical protein
MDLVLCLNFLHLISYCDPGFSASIFPCSLIRHFPISFSHRHTHTHTHTNVVCILTRYILSYRYIVPSITLRYYSPIMLHLYVITTTCAPLCRYMLCCTPSGPCIVSLLKSLSVQCPYVLFCAVLCPYMLCCVPTGRYIRYILYDTETFFHVLTHIVTCMSDYRWGLDW